MNNSLSSTSRQGDSFRSCKPQSGQSAVMDENLPTFSVIIPAFNEELGLAPTLAALEDALPAKDFEIIVVDDGSTDRTAEIARQFSRIALIQHSSNRGYGSAIQTGTLASKGRYIIWCDSDGQHRIEDLLGVAETISKGDLDYVIGTRDTRSHEVLNRRFGKAILRTVVGLAAGQPIRDFNCGLRGFKRSLLKRYLHLLPPGFGASTTTTLLMLERHYKGSFYPVVILERLGKSTVRQVRDGLRTLMLILRIFLIFKPMLFFGSIGAASVAIGSIYGVWVSLSDRAGFPVLAAAVIIFGFQALFFGLICDQISGIRRERMQENCEE
jgi:glycosyltransferase involved in cell wall biosynthesis